MKIEKVKPIIDDGILSIITNAIGSISKKNSKLKSWINKKIKPRT